MHEANRYPKPFGKYVLLRQLAIGGMAEVYLARHSGPEGFEKECVIKRILPNLAVDKQFVQMFLDEARIAARLSHPNIVQIYEFGTVAERDYFIAMEHVHGVDLQQIVDEEMARGGRVPLAIALRLISNVAEGLDHAHRATDGRGQPLGVVHRDVTPSNVIVSFDGMAKILDFGIAKAVAKQGRTEVGVIKGKIPFMSPEQVQGEALDGRSDLFSLCSVLYELTTGQKPFEGTNAAELSLKIAHDDPTPPEMLVDGYPEALSAIVRRAHSKKRQGRFATAREMQEAIEELVISSAIRCTSHDVAAYLENLFPGRRERQTREDEMPVEANDPTMPMTIPTGSLKLGLGDESDRSPAGPMMGGDLSGHSLGNYEDVKRNLGGSGGGLKVVVVGLVVAVAVGFWWLRGHTAPAQANTAPAPAVLATPAAPTPPLATPQKTALAPVEPRPLEAKPDPAAKPVEAKPAEAKPPIAAVSEKPPTPKSRPARRAAPPEEAPRALPHLPSPPPEDDSP